MKLAGAVTFYHCDVGQFIKNINSYLNELDILYVLDNNEQINNKLATLFCEYQNIKYIPFKENKGLSAAFNFALKKAQKDNCTFLLTMDQDSAFTEGTMILYKNKVLSYEEAHPNETAVYSINYDSSWDKPEEGVRQIHIAITSGSIIPVEIAIKLGGFDENLFIDQVDTEFCYRAEKAGYKIIEFPSILMNHSIGNQTWHHFFKYKVGTLNHGPIRKYYITRNKIYVMKKYPEVIQKYIKEIVKMIFKVILFEKNKKCKLFYIGKGIIDALIGKMGRMS